MTILDIANLLAPISGDARSGPNLEYDPGFTALERAATGKPEQVIGGSTTAAEPPDWAVALSLALELLARTKDLRVAVLAARALLYRNGVEGFAEGLALLRGLLEQHWSTVHPQLDPDDDNDPTMRITALAALSTPMVLLKPCPVPFSDQRPCSTQNTSTGTGFPPGAITSSWPIVRS